MRRVIISGATGFIGSWLTTHFLTHTQAQIYTIVRPSSPRSSVIPRHSRITPVLLEQTDPEAYVKNLPKANVFFDMAWAGVRGQARYEEIIQQQNIQRTICNAYVAAELQCDVFVGCGSQAEYGVKSEEITEETLPIPTTAYGRAKLEAGREAAKIAQQANMRFVWPRIFSVYGQRDAEDTLIMTTLRKMIVEEKIDFGPCTQNWDYLYAEDAVAALRFLAMCPQAQGIFNVASGQTHSLRWFLETMRKVTKSRSELCYDVLPSSKAIVGFSADVHKLADLGWRPEIPFTVGIKRLYEALKEVGNEKSECSGANL